MRIFFIGIQIPINVFIFCFFSHLVYIENSGWTIASFDSIEQVTLDFAPKTIANYKAANITFIEDFIGKELNITTYKLGNSGAFGL